MTKKYFFIGLLAILNGLSTLFISGDIVLPNALNLVLIMLFFVLKLSLKEKPLGLIISFCYFQMSLVWAPALWYFLSNKIQLEAAFRVAFMFGIFFQILILLILKFSDKFLRGKSLSPPTLKTIFLVNPFYLTTLFFSCLFFFSLASHYLGVSAMGIEKDLVLPYKLEPLLNILRGNVFPIISILFFLKLKGQKKHQIYFLTLYTVWAIFEVWAKGSKAFLVIAYFPFLLILLHRHFFSARKAFYFCMTFLVIFIGNYVIGDYIRENKMNLEKHNIQRKNYLQFVLKEAYFRLFPDAVLISRFQQYKPKYTNKDLFEKERGAPNIHTYIIDRFPRDAPHSSGITALTDGFLFAGYPGLLICGVLIIITFSFFDFFMNKMLGIKVIGITYFFHCLILGEGFISYLFFRNPLTSLAAPIAVALTYAALQKVSLKKTPNVPKPPIKLVV